MYTRILFWFCLLKGSGSEEPGGQLNESQSVLHNCLSCNKVILYILYIMSVLRRYIHFSASLSVCQLWRLWCCQTGYLLAAQEVDTVTTPFNMCSPLTMCSIVFRFQQVSVIGVVIHCLFQPYISITPVSTCFRNPCCPVPQRLYT